MEVLWGKYMQGVIFVLLNNRDKCTHCYLCGADNHPPKRCPSKSNQGNCWN